MAKLELIKGARRKLRYPSDCPPLSYPGRMPEPPWSLKQRLDPVGETPDAPR